MTGNQTYECDIAQLDSIVFSEAQTNPVEEIVVTVDPSGNADGGHWFEKIDESNYYIDNLKYTIQDGDLVVSGYDEVFFTGEAKIISILNYRGRTMNVVKIGDRAFSSCSSLTSVTIPNGVTSIGDFAFNNCRSLSDASIGSGVTSIGTRAFNLCTHLTSITIPNGVTSIGSEAFQSCYSLTSIIIPNSVTSIGDSAFEGCSSLTDISIGSGLSCIDFEVFNKCSSLTSITIPNNVSSIEGNAFKDCRGLTSVTIGYNVTCIRYHAFRGCRGLTDVYCLAPNVPEANEGDAFAESSIASATLHVPAASVEAYSTTEPWKNFGSIVAIE